MYTTQAHKKWEMQLKCVAPLIVGHVQTLTLSCTTVWLTIFVPLGMTIHTVVVKIKCFAPLYVGHVQNQFSNAPLCVWLAFFSIRLVCL